MIRLVISLLLLCTIFGCKTYTLHNFGGCYFVRIDEITSTDLYLYPDSSYYYSALWDHEVTGCWEIIGKDSIILNSDWQPLNGENQPYTITEEYNDYSRSSDSFYVSFSACNGLDSVFITLVEEEQKISPFKVSHQFHKEDTIHISIWENIVQADIVLSPHNNCYTIHFSDFHLSSYPVMTNSLWVWDKKKKRLKGEYPLHHYAAYDEHLWNLFKDYGNRFNMRLIDAFRTDCKAPESK